MLIHSTLHVIEWRNSTPCLVLLPDRGYGNNLFSKWKLKQPRPRRDGLNFIFQVNKIINVTQYGKICKQLLKYPLSTTNILLLLVHKL